MKRPRWVSRQSPAQFFSLLQRRLPRDSFCGMSFMERPLLAQSGRWSLVHLRFCIGLIMCP
jgi:hypothetical protein